MVSTIASLQNSMPVQAIVFCRHAEGRADSPIVSRSASRPSSTAGSTPISTIFWYGVSRAPATAYLSIRSASRTSSVPDTRPTVGAIPTYILPSC